MTISDIPFDRLESAERKSSNSRQLIRARLTSGELFKMEVPPGGPEAEFPDHVYAARQFTELEFHSPIAELRENGEIMMREFWTLQAPDGEAKEAKTENRP